MNVHGNDFWRLIRSSLYVEPAKVWISSAQGKKDLATRAGTGKHRIVLYRVQDGLITSPRR